MDFTKFSRIYVEEGEFAAVTAGRQKHRARGRGGLPAVGDWVVVRKRPDENLGVIMAVLPRRSAFTRRAAGEATGEQVVAANVDVVFVVMGLDRDYNVRRLERYMVMARESGASPVILLTKPDLCSDLAAHLREVTSFAGDILVHAVNPKRGGGLEQVPGGLRAG